MSRRNTASPRTRMKIRSQIPRTNEINSDSIAILTWFSGFWKLSIVAGFLSVLEIMQLISTLFSLNYVFFKPDFDYLTSNHLQIW
ncbi:hypothetical protein HRI_004264800 [Hibiscus trionum]|uniref:Uncharacterized protein n=1 Tax=Hibiscus trionum TaxID=183268 RepID=A0A9W7J1B9_HIBTR|nr:hypothetical protein HRI_004264800 [Hibiscus trionum]